MRIESSTIAMQSTHSLSITREEASAFTATVATGSGGGGNAAAVNIQTVSTSSEQSSKASLFSASSLVSRGGQFQAAYSSLSFAESVTQAVFNTTGSLSMVRSAGASTGESLAQGAGGPTESANGRASANATQSLPDTSAELIISSYQAHTEQEHTTVQAAGNVTTEDGRTIDFQMLLSLERQFSSEEMNRLDIQVAKLTDPLTINFKGTGASLSDTTFQFDLNSDGKAEQMNFVAPGSGLLMLDRNKDGVATDGSELFGVATGNGFNELAAYDEDGNGWIDENDSVFSQLSIWQKSLSGQDSYRSLTQAGVGAIFLGNVSSQFDLTDSSNNLQGRIQSTGFALMESGEVRSVQQVDLATEEVSAEIKTEKEAHGDGHGHKVRRRRHGEGHARGQMRGHEHLELKMNLAGPESWRGEGAGNSSHGRTKSTDDFMKEHFSLDRLVKEMEKKGKKMTSMDKLLKTLDELDRVMKG